MRPTALRRDLLRLLDRLGLGDDPDAPRELAVVLALRDGIPLRDALERLGVDTAPLDLPPPPEAVPFAQILPGHAFAWQGHVWTRATLDQALAATPDRRARPRVVAAYLAAVQRRQPATAFRWDSDVDVPAPVCLAERVDADALVYPVDRPAPAPMPSDPPSGDPPSWTSTADRSPDVGRTVSVDTPDGPVAARLLLGDEFAGGGVWETEDGGHLDLDEVSRWRP